MLKEEQTVLIQSFDTDTALSIAYETFKSLSWTPLFAGPDKLLATTIKDRNSYPQQFIVGIEGAQMHLSSEMVHGESFDIGNRNEKNIRAFITAFQQVENTITEETIVANRQQLNSLRETTQQAAEEDARQREELDKVMHLSNRNLAVTYSIIGINILVFAVLLVKGVPLFTPSGLDLLPWGANFGPFTLSGEWWRLITNVFLHFGILHIGFNMYALYMIGIYLEPMLGKLRYTAAYLCTGVLASAASLWWHLGSPAISAGASGAIFGMYGVFLALLSTSLIPQKVRRTLLQSIGVFVVFNLLFGVKSGIDNAAHIGGLLSGLVIGYAYYFSLKKETTVKQIALTCALVIASTALGMYVLLKKLPAPTEKEVAELRQGVEEAKYPDAAKFDTNYNQIIQLQNEALRVFMDSSIKTNEQLGDSVYVVSKPKWKEAEMLALQMVQYRVSDRMKQKANVLLKYVRQRQEEVETICQVGRGKQARKPTLDSIRTQMNITIDSLQKL